MKKTIIVGGGLAGLVTANILGRAGLPCAVIEKKGYPFHRVCGEYVSNETTPYLRSLGLYPERFDPPQINRFQLTSVNGRSAELPLDLGGFGISRYTFDEFLYQKAKAVGVEFFLNTDVASIHFEKDCFEIRANQQVMTADIVVGAFGKRSRLDVHLNRNFIRQRSPYVAVKYHIRTAHPLNLISLHNFHDGYCGISNIEDGKSCLCYLVHRKRLKEFGSIKSLEENILYKNPFLKSIFCNSEFLFDTAETINEISFSTKERVVDHILMCGDAAGMITPLCGNGMAMAVHSAKILSKQITDFCNGKILRGEQENNYTHQWNAQFLKRLWTGRQIQKLFGSVLASDMAVNIARHAKPLARFLISKTHGNPF